MNTNLIANFKGNSANNILKTFVNKNLNKKKFEDKSISRKKIVLGKINTFVNLSSVIDSGLFLDENNNEYPDPKLADFSELFKCIYFY